MGKVSIDVDINLDNIIEGLKTTFDDSGLRYSISNAVMRYCDPYVPMLNNPLSKTTEVTPQGVTYTQPYARYQYYGEVYGPNYPIIDGGTLKGFFTNPYGKKAPIIEGGVVVGWYSPPHKHPTGRKINYRKDYHPLATHHWDEAMMRDMGEQFCEEVGDLIVHKWEELYGDGR